MCHSERSEESPSWPSPGDSEDPLHCRVDVLLTRIDFQRRGVARLRLRLLSLFFVNAAEPIVGAGDGRLVVFRDVPEVLLQCRLTARRGAPGEGCRVSDLKVRGHVRRIEFQG